MKRVTLFFPIFLFLNFLLTMALVACVHCNVTAESHKIVNCSICRKAYKIDCVDISNAEARKIHSNTGFSWSCGSCADLGNDLNSLKAIIVALRDEIETLKNTVNGTKPTSSSLSLLESEKIIQEFSEREKRKNNLIIYGSNETSNSNKDQIVVDTASISEIFAAVSVEVPEFKVLRLGKFDSSNTSRRRPIKVQLSDESTVLSILKASRNIKSFPRWSNLGFSRDRTLMQREIYRNARTQLQHRLDGGERNIRIKYINGLPEIVSSENQSSPTVSHAH